MKGPSRTLSLAMHLASHGIGAHSRQKKKHPLFPQCGSWWYRLQAQSTEYRCTAACKVSVPYLARSICLIEACTAGYTSRSKTGGANVGSRFRQLTWLVSSRRVVLLGRVKLLQSLSTSMSNTRRRNTPLLSQRSPALAVSIWHSFISLTTTGLPNWPSKFLLAASRAVVK